MSRSLNITSLEPEIGKAIAAIGFMEQLPGAAIRRYLT
jgi:hypothetical protein